MEFSINRGWKFTKHHLLSVLLKQRHLCSEPLLSSILLLYPHIEKWNLQCRITTLSTQFLSQETARICIRDLSKGFYECVVTLPIKIWYIIEHTRQQFDTYHQGQVSITEIQLGSQAMGHEVAVISAHYYPHVNGSDFPVNYVAGSIQYTFPWEEGQIPNNWFHTPETSQVSSPGPQNNLLQIVSNAGRSEQIELNVFI